MKLLDVQVTNIRIEQTVEEVDCSPEWYARQGLAPGSQRTIVSQPMVVDISLRVHLDGLRPEDLEILSIDPKPLFDVTLEPNI